MLCVRGYQENIVPRSDSSTATTNLLKVSLAVAANEGWRLENLDVTSAFLQGTDLEREIYVLPPKEIKQEGQLWKLKKGTVDPWFDLGPLRYHQKYGAQG